MRLRCLLLVAGLALAGCGTPPPPPQLYQLRIEAPPAAVPAPRAGNEVWELATALRLPEYLDRETIVVSSGGAGLQPLDGHRWAEPLRDSVPRLLRHDLGLLRGADKVWPAPAPAGVAVARQLRVELLALQATADRAAVHLSARWWLVDPRGQAAPLLGQADLRVPTAGTGVDAIAGAHRAALWQLAERIADTAAAPAR